MEVWTYYCQKDVKKMAYKKGFIPYALAALLIGLVGGFSTVLGPAFVQDIGIAYQNTTWTALAQAMSTAACALWQILWCLCSLPGLW